MPIEPHIEISSLWEYSRSANPAALQPAEWDHLKTYNDCVVVLWACNASDSLERAQEKLKEFGLSGPDANA